LSNSLKIYCVGINPGALLQLQGVAGSSTRRVIDGTPVESVESLGDRPDVLVCVDLDSRARALAKRAKGKSDTRTVLVMSEPSVVIPHHDNPKALETFDEVLRVGRPGATPFLPWPQKLAKLPVLRGDSESDRIVMIQSRKYSFVSGQLYSLRALVANSDSRLDVFGVGWDEPWFRTVPRLIVEFFRALDGQALLDPQTLRTAFLRPLNYKGPVESKIQAMSTYRVALVVENSQEYMSEKLFDSFIGGCIPIYLGANLTDFDIPRDLYVRANPNLDSISDAIAHALEMDYDSWLERLNRFLSSQQVVERWDEEESTLRILRSAIFGITRNNSVT